MLVLTKTYENGFERKFTVRSASYSNAEHTAAIVITDESGAVMVYENPNDTLWQQLQASGFKIDEYVEPVLEQPAE